MIVKVPKRHTGFLDRLLRVGEMELHGNDGIGKALYLSRPPLSSLVRVEKREGRRYVARLLRRMCKEAETGRYGVYRLL